MTPALLLPDSLSLDDLHTFLGRALAIDEGGATRLIAAPSGDAGVLAAYVGVLAPAGLLDASPTVLGLRTFALAGSRRDPSGAGAAEDSSRPQSSAHTDVVVPLRAVVERTTKLQGEVVDPTAPVAVPLPPAVIAASWAAISPPRGGWMVQEPVDGALLESTARAGIEEVAAVIPAGTGEQIVQRVRSGVWSRAVEGASGIPAGAAFAALALGFLGSGEPVRVFTVSSWTRLSTSRGHVLVRRRGSIQ